ncbi:MAG: MBL fold metallo-hydrolase [Alphaproteobacteria bacterium]|nr:MBL fold metallo-hydrolase [Alphaproteobacteria bacterium]
MATLTIMGCGGSGGVPLATNYWGACNPANPRNRRMRASVAVTNGDKTIVVDTGPDFREQTIRYGLKTVDGVLYTHGHSDHTNGIDELRYVSILAKQRVPIWADDATLQELQSRFSHIFLESADGIYQPVVTPHIFTNSQYGKTVDILGMPVVPFWQKHGVSGRSLGFRFGDIAYSTDVSGLDDAAFAALKGIKTWVVDCAQFGSDFTVVHANFEMVESWNAQVGAQRVILTHLTPRVDYDECAQKLPKGYEPAYDGMQIEFCAS